MRNHGNHFLGRHAIYKMSFPDALLTFTACLMSIAAHVIIVLIDSLFPVLIVQFAQGMMLSSVR